jgi:hypothetical protein
MGIRSVYSPEGIRQILSVAAQAEAARHEQKLQQLQFGKDVTPG